MLLIAKKIGKSEHKNVMKYLAWLILPAVLVVAAVMWVNGNKGGTFPEPKVLETNTQGMLLSLPVVSIDKSVAWQAEWVAESEPGRQAVLQALATLSAQYQQLRPQLQVVAFTGLENREKYARRLGTALAQNNLGKAELISPLAEDENKVGVILKCAQGDATVGRKFLGALSPYLGGRVALMYDESLKPSTMQLLLYGVPYFNAQGQATFDPNLYDKK